MLRSLFALLHFSHDRFKIYTSRNRSEDCGSSYSWSTRHVYSRINSIPSELHRRAWRLCGSRNICHLHEKNSWPCVWEDRTLSSYSLVLRSLFSLLSFHIWQLQQRQFAEPHSSTEPRSKVTSQQHTTNWLQCSVRHASTIILSIQATRLTSNGVSSFQTERWQPFTHGSVCRRIQTLRLSGMSAATSSTLWNALTMNCLRMAWQTTWQEPFGRAGFFLFFPCCAWRKPPLRLLCFAEGAPPALGFCQQLLRLWRKFFTFFICTVYQLGLG